MMQRKMRFCGWMGGQGGGGYDVKKEEEVVEEKEERVAEETKNKDVHNCGKGKVARSILARKKIR